MPLTLQVTLSDEQTRDLLSSNDSAARRLVNAITEVELDAQRRAFQRQNELYSRPPARRPTPPITVAGA